LETTRIGVVGAGRWGPHLVRIFEENSRSRVTAIADSDPDRRTRIGELHPGVDVLASADDLLARPDLDAVVLATPSETHHRLAARALDRGLHTFVEKPLARSAAEAEDLVRRSERSGAVLFAGHVFLFNPAIRAARAQIAAGELGCIRYLQSIRTNLGPVRTDVSALWDLAPHDLSIFRHWLGADPVRATAKGGTYLNDGLEDVVFATLEYPGGVLANLVVTWLAPRKIRQITAVGDRRMLVFDDRSPDGAVLLYDRGVDAGDPGVTETI
jgi:predicted dehydrogenase